MEGGGDVHANSTPLKIILYNRNLRIFRQITNIIIIIAKYTQFVPLLSHETVNGMQI